MKTLGCLCQLRIISSLPDIHYICLQRLNTREYIDGNINYTRETSSDSGATAQLNESADVDATGSQEENMTESMTEFKPASTADVDATGSQEDNMTDSMTEFKPASTADVDATGSQEDNMTDSMTEFKPASTADVDATGPQKDNVTESLSEFKQPSTTDTDMFNCEMLVKKEDDSIPIIEQVSESTWCMQNPDCTIYVNTANDSSVLCPPINDASTSELSPSTKHIIEHVSESTWCVQNPDCAIGVKIDYDSSALSPPSNDASASELLPPKASETLMETQGYDVAASIRTMTEKRKWQRNIEKNNETHIKADIDAAVNHILTPVVTASGPTNILDDPVEGPEQERKKRRSKRQHEQQNSTPLELSISSTTAKHFEGGLTPTDSTDIEKQAGDEYHQFVKNEKTTHAEPDLTPVSSSSPDTSQTLKQAAEECDKPRKKKKSKTKPPEAGSTPVASSKPDLIQTLKQAAEGFEDQTKQAFECLCGDHELEPGDVKPRAQCEKCGLWQHAECIKYDLADPRRGRYLCPHCHAVVVSGHFGIPVYRLSHFVYR